MPEKEPLLSFTPLNNRHLDEVLEIERSGLMPFWEKDSFIQASRSNTNYCYVLCSGKDSDVIGFIAIQSADHHLAMLNIGVRKDCRRKGFGRLLISGVRARHPNCAIHVVCNEMCLDVQLFLHHCSFICESIIAGDPTVYLFILPQDSIG